MLAIAVALLLAWRDPGVLHEPLGLARAQSKLVPPQLVELPRVPFDSKRYAATAEEQEEIQRCIAELSQIDKPDFGLSSTFSGGQFAALEDTQHVSTLIFGPHGVSTSPALRRLVELGPKAIPALLAALDDATPTQLVFVHDRHFGGMWSAREVPTNPRNPFEQVAVKEIAWLADCMELGNIRDRLDLERHEVTRGDVAFVVLGQIAGREYQAVRYQPSGNNVVNSPTRDPEIATALRRIWSSDDPARRLFDSLLHDYCTRGGVFRGGDWPTQYPAALRLAYYFPEESSAFLVQRLDSLDLERVPWQSPGYSEAWRKQDEANGCYAPTLIEMLAQCRDTAVIDALGRAVERATPDFIVGSVLKGPCARAKPELLAKQIEGLLAQKPDRESGPFGTEFKLLQATLRFFPERAQGCFETWLGHKTLDCSRAVVHALARSEQRVDWAVPLLLPLLEKRTDTGWEYGPDYDRHAILLCDEAARALAVHLEGGSFVQEGNRRELDRQIENLRRLVQHLPPLPEPPPPPPFDFASLARRQPVASVDVDLELRPIFADSDDQTLHAIQEVEVEGQGWSAELISLDVGSGVASTILLPPWKDREWQILQPMRSDRIACYDGNADGAIDFFDAHTGAALGRVVTPFRRNLPDEDPLKVHGLSDMVLTDRGRSALAFTRDGALHAVDLASGAHEVVWRAPEDDPSISIVPIEGTARVLIESMSEEETLRVWDHSTRTMSVLERMPSWGWKSARGRFAINQRGAWELWNLETCKQVPLELPPDAKASAVLADLRGRRAFVRADSGAVYVYELPTGKPRAILDGIAPAQVIELDTSADGRWLFASELWRQGPDGPALPMRVSIFEVGSPIR